MIIRSRAPLRLGLAGGGTDVSPYCDQYGGTVLNVTIDLYAFTVIEPLAKERVEFIASDLGQTFSGTCDEAMEVAYPLILHRAVYRRVIQQFNGGRPLGCRITTFCDSPPGSGLGSSSTMVVSLLKGFVEWLNLPLGDYEIARLAFDCERVDAGLQGGRQDQYAATFGGVNFMEFYANERAIVNPLRVKNWIMCELESSLVLFNSGVSRSSAKIIEQQAANVTAGQGKSIEALHKMKEDAIGMKETLLKGDIPGFSRFMRESWEAKKRLSDGITTTHIDQIHDAAMAAGAMAAKVSGAGGGGFMTLLVDPARRVDVTRALSQQEGEVVNCHFTRDGCQSWRII